MLEAKAEDNSFFEDLTSLTLTASVRDLLNTQEDSSAAMAGQEQMSARTQMIGRTYNCQTSYDALPTSTTTTTERRTC